MIAVWGHYWEFNDIWRIATGIDPVPSQWYCLVILFNQGANIYQNTDTHTMYHLVDFDVLMKISVNITNSKYYINVYNEYKLFFTYDYVETELLDRWVKFNATFYTEIK